MIAKITFLLYRISDNLRPKLYPFSSLIPVRLITWKAYWGLLPISILSTMLFIAPEINTKPLFLAWLAISFLGHASVAPFVIYFNGKFGRKTHIFFGFCMGAVRGATVNLTAPILRVEDPLPFAIRVLASSLSVAYALIFAGIVISIWTKFDSDLRQLLKNAVELGASEPKSDDSKRTLEISESRVNIRQVLAELNEYIVLTSNGGDSSRTLKEQANAIDRLINRHIRPHSAERWRNAELIWPKIRPWDVLRESISKTKLPIIATIFFTLPISLSGQFAKGSFITGAVIQSTAIVLQVLLVKIAERLARETKKAVRNQNLVIFAGVFLVILPILILLSYFFDLDTYTSVGHLLQIHTSSMLTFMFIALICSIVITVQENRDNALDLLEDIVSKQALSKMIQGGVASSAESEYAQYLHAEVQSQLMACKLLLLKAAESDFTLMSPEVTQKVLDRLELLNQPYEKLPDRIPSARLHEFQKTWEGLAKIYFTLPSELSKVSRNGEIITQLIEELIVNAIRHGKAKSITVSATIVDGYCIISVLDDGQIKSTKKPGLGSTLFEVFAPDWKLVSTSQGTLATLTAKYY